jgi:hypothetical protein
MLCASSSMSAIGVVIVGVSMTQPLISVYGVSDGLLSK